MKIILIRVYEQQTPSGFKYGFCDCCGNSGDCLFACCCPHCYTFVAGKVRFIMFSDSGLRFLV